VDVGHGSIPDPMSAKPTSVLLFANASVRRGAGEHSLELLSRLDRQLCHSLAQPGRCPCVQPAKIRKRDGAMLSRGVSATLTAPGGTAPAATQAQLTRGKPF
jgi:hypothetical protein